MVSEIKMNQEKLKMLQAQVRIGGKGTVRRRRRLSTGPPPQMTRSCSPALRNFQSIIFPASRRST